MACQDNIRYQGWLENERLIDYYFISNVFVLPAHWEPWGLVINEAMAAGKPVIVSDQVGCVDDLVIDGQTGLIVKSQSVNALFDAMNYFYTHLEECQRMSKRALQLISNWTLQDEAKCICAAWSNVI